MKKTLQRVLFCITFFAPTFLFAQSGDDLDRYIKRLKDDHAGARNETGFLSVGADFLYAQEYFEAKNYDAAATRFMEIVNKQKDHAFANYQLAVSLMRQNNDAKNKQARQFFAHAFQLNPSLKMRLEKDVPDANRKKIDPPKTSKGGATSLEEYIEKLKYSRDTRGAETAMNTAGREAVAGVEYYEQHEFGSAETSFALALAIDGNNPYVNYLMAVSLAAQGKKDASRYLQKAVEGDAVLSTHYVQDVAKATAEWKKLQATKTVSTKPGAPLVKGGALVYGKYSCSQSVWNGPNVSPAYSFQYKGYFELKPNGTYRWLDNGGTGSYKYDAKTGDIFWTSGHFKVSGAKSSQYLVDKESVQINVKFSESNSWICGCKK